ncbi:hypothetical protein LVJ94_13890 [Pendulispora rubella]|uniref:DUF304 domain-containing protein n=1 Tax=Pendulispora rubella TaxID=2741070 RepID=A0ABZ2LEL3_9BACT
MGSTNEKTAPGSLPLVGIPGIHEVSTPSELRIVIDAPIWATAGWCFLILFAITLLNTAILAYVDRVSPGATWRDTVRSMSVPAWIVLPFLSFKLGLLARAHTLIVTPEEIRVLWGRWTRTMKLSDCRDIWTYEIKTRRVRGRMHGSAFGIQFVGPRWPIQIIGRVADDDHDPLGTAHILRARVRYVMAAFKMRDIERVPYRGSE